MSPGPRGAQYSPVLDISSPAAHSMRDLAASSGDTANEQRNSVLTKAHGREHALIRVSCSLTTTLIPELIEADTLGHPSPHEARVNDGYDDSPVLQVKA